MNGCQDKQLQILKKKAYRLAPITGTSELNRFEASIAYSQIYIPTIQYCLPAMQLCENK